MSDDIAERVRRIRQSREAAPAEALPPPAPAVPPAANDAGLADDSSSQVGLSQRPEVSLRLRFQDGRRRALPYFMLQDIALDPGELVMEYVHCRVRIRGRNLTPLFDRLADHKVRYVREMEELAAEQFPDGETVVTSISVEEPERPV